MTAPCAAPAFTSVQPRTVQPLRDGVVTLRAARAVDAAFVDALTRQTMLAYVARTWSNVSDIAAYFAKNRFDPEHTEIVQCNGQDVGRLTLLVTQDELFVDNIHVQPELQGRGIGGAVLRHVIARARREGRAVRLQCLRVNPAAKLYRRLGFVEQGQDATHFFLRLPSQRPTRSPVVQQPRLHDPGPRELAESHPRVPFFILLKMDVQGFEMEVLKGAEHSLASIETIQLELALTPTYQNQMHLHEMCGLLYQKGYTMVSIEPGSHNRLTGRQFEVDGLFHRYAGARQAHA